MGVSACSRDDAIRVDGIAAADPPASVSAGEGEGQEGGGHRGRAWTHVLEAIVSLAWSFCMPLDGRTGRRGRCTGRESRGAARSGGARAALPPPQEGHRRGSRGTEGSGRARARAGRLLERVERELLPPDGGRSSRSGEAAQLVRRGGGSWRRWAGCKGGLAASAGAALALERRVGGASRGRSLLLGPRLRAETAAARCDRHLCAPRSAQRSAAHSARPRCEHEGAK